MMYEYNDVPEPTCVGEWWRHSPQYVSPSIVTVYQAAGHRMMWHLPYQPEDCPCLEEGITWTGPILVPEDKPARERAHKTIMGSARAAFHFKSKPAPSKAEGEKRVCPSCNGRKVKTGTTCFRCLGSGFELPKEKLGREFWAIMRSEGLAAGPWEEVGPSMREGHCKVARRFRAECIAPWKGLEEAARACVKALHNPNVDNCVRRIFCVGELGAALATLPNQGEAAKQELVLDDCPICEKAVYTRHERTWRAPHYYHTQCLAAEDKPRMSDQELGQFADEVRHRYASYSLRGAAIRAKLEATITEEKPAASPVSDEDLADIIRRAFLDRIGKVYTAEEWVAVVRRLRVLIGG